MKKQRIVLIEDDAIMSLVMKEELGKVGFDVTIARTGQNGLRQVAAKMPSLVLLDLVLPDISGYEVLKRLKGDDATKKIPIIILTALSMDENISKVMVAGASDYFVKSQHAVIELIEMIEQFLRGTNDQSMPNTLVKMAG